MKKQTLLITLLLTGAINLFAQVSQGDIQLMQQYFGTEKTALIKETMKLTPAQDSVFWPVYTKYENERQQLGKERIQLVQQYLKNIENVTEDKATMMVNSGVALEIKFKNLQKKYFAELTKKVGAVKAAQFYQLENYLNNVVNLSIQEEIPFVGDLEQKHSQAAGKK